MKNPPLSLYRCSRTNRRQHRGKGFAPGARHHTPAAGFTLIELLAVISIIALAAVFAMPATVSVMQGSQLGSTGETLAGKLQAARLTAISRNRPVEVRFYKYDDFLIPGDDKTFRACQQFLVEVDGTPKAIEKPYKLPNSLALNTSSEFSTILDPDRGMALVKLSATERVGDIRNDNEKGAYYVAFRFRPDGSTDLPGATENWFVTIVNFRDRELSSTDDVHNYATVQVDPVNGNVRLFRP